MSGVVKNEVAPSAAYGSMQSSRVINLIVGGRVNTFNIWGGPLSPGTPLYILLKKKLRSKESYITARANSNRALSTREYNTPHGELECDYHWQATPYASSKEPTPPAGVLRYTTVDENSDTKVSAYGTAVRVGFSGEDSEDNASVAQLVHRFMDPASMRNVVLPTIEIFVGV